MKKRIISIILLLLCASLTLSACTMIKEPETLKADLEAKGYTVFLYSRLQSEQFTKMLNLILLDEADGVYGILIAEGGTDKETAKPLIVYYCDSKETTDTVFDAARSSLTEVAKFTGMDSPDDCNLKKVDNCVIMGDPDMIKLTEASF